MNTAKKFALILALVMLLSFADSAYSEDSYHYAVTNMTWAEFYSGEIGSNFNSSEYDAVSTATQRFSSRLNQLVSENTDSGGTVYSGVKAVQVRMTQDVYDILSSDTRYSSWDVSEFDEYKDVDASGSFGAMVSKTQKVDGVSVTLASGPSTHHTQYALEISGLDLASLGLKLGEGSGRTSTFDYYLGGLLETSDGKKYGLKHLDNLWVNTSEIGFCVEAYTDNGDKGYLHTADLTGKTITKITFMLKNQADPYIDGLNVYVRQKTTAAAAPVYKDGFNAYEAGMSVEAKFEFTNAPSDSNYNEVVSLAYDDPNGHHGWSTAAEDSYTYSDGVLTITDMTLASATHSYNIVFGDSAGKYINIGTSFKVFSVNADDKIMSQENNAAYLNFLLTPAGAIDAVDKELEDNNFVNASDYTDPEKNFSVVYSDGENEIAGSGFSFDITLNEVPEGKIGIVGFGKIFYLTPDNCGIMYGYLYNKISAMPVGESGYIEIGDGSKLAAMGLKVNAIQEDGTIRDVTEYTGAGLQVSDDKNILVYYGVMLADCDNGKITEGEYALSTEGETLLSDGKADGHIKSAWYIELVPQTEAAIINDSDNKGSVTFQTMRKGMNESSDEIAEARKFVWLYEDNIDDAECEALTGKENQVSGGGFTFSITADEDAITEGYTPVIGFERNFIFTADNLGSKDFNALRESIKSLPSSLPEEYIKIYGDWKMPEDGFVLNSAGVKVMASYPSNASRAGVSAMTSSIEDQEVTGLMSHGFLLSGDDAILMTYGGVAVDRELTSNEGERIDTGGEENPLISDGVKDNVINISWYITHSESDNNGDILKSSSGGCDSINIIAPALMLSVLLLAKYKK